MCTRTVDENLIQQFCNHLACEEKSRNTIEKYIRDIRNFLNFVGSRNVDKETVLLFKEHLKQNYKIRSVNSMLAGLNCFFEFMGWSELKVKAIKFQQQLFCEKEKEITKEEYRRLCATAERNDNQKLSMILQTLCGTGIRISELCCITVEAVNKGEAIVLLKGKTRRVFIVKALREKLLRFIKAEGIHAGNVFVTKNGKPMNRSNIWKAMKALCLEANVDPSKVFPHNLRHLFARIFYGLEKDISKLADILGHSSINTTRIYIISSGDEHIRIMESMRLII